MKASSKRAELRLSQIITTFGPGAMVDLPTRSVIVGGLERWNMREKDSWKTLSEPRLQNVLQKILSESGRIAEGVSLTLRTPPVDPQLPGREPPGIDVTIFPTWFVSDHSENAQGVRKRRLVQWQHLDASRGRQSFEDNDGTRRSVTPIRFVAGCKKGHIQDIDWHRMVHQGKTCRETLSLEERGTTGDPRNIKIICDCGVSFALNEATIPGRLGHCTGMQPWLEQNAENGCSETLRFLPRTATNAYFSQVLTVISLPASGDELERLVRTNFGVLSKAEDVVGVAGARKYNDHVAAALDGFDDGTVFDRIQRIKKEDQQDLAKNIKLAEFELLGSGNTIIGENQPDAELHAETLLREVWGGNDPYFAPISTVVSVHRLREVSCLYGFTRFESAPTSIDGDIEEIYIAVDGAPIASELTWLPAIEQFGEGIFLHFDAAVIANWLAQDQVSERGKILSAGFMSWVAHQSDDMKSRNMPSLSYLMLHSLSHAVMAEIALECGYPATALKERIYTLEDGTEPGRFGILLYTASAGAQGTLGGLLSVIPRLGALIIRAIERLNICSGDPICADHDPQNQTDDRALHGAACHSCLLVAETSCEQRNLFLDRALVTNTLSQLGSGIFTT